MNGKMSNIRVENTNLSIYTSILQEAISDIKQKVEITDDEVEWIIFDEQNYIETEVCNKISTPSFVYKAQYKYGFCYIDKNQIYVSTAAIMTFNVVNLKRQAGKMFCLYEEKSILLINVLLDELAHIKTRKKHGDFEYDRTLKSYRSAYYGK